MTVFLRSLFSCVILAAGTLLLPGCTGESDDDTTALVSNISYALKLATNERNAQRRTNLLRSAYDEFERVEPDWPESKAKYKFLNTYGDQLRRAPQTVYEIAKTTRDLESFKWAVEHGVHVEMNDPELLTFWRCGPEWRTYFVSEYPEQTLPFFMNKAIENQTTSFFNAYAGAFKASGFKINNPLETTDFNSRYCRFVADSLEAAMQQHNKDRIEFLLDHMPSLGSVVHVDRRTKETMRKLGDVLFHELEDEALALKLIALGYDLNPITLSTTPFSPDFTAALSTDPERMVTLLTLNTWHGPLTAEEADVLIALPDHALESVDNLLIGECIEYCIKHKNNPAAVRLVLFREQRRPLNQYGYDELLAWAVKYENQAFFNYVTDECDYLNQFGIEFIKLAGQYDLFVKYAPDVLKKVHPTMKRHTVNDGVTFGIVYEVLSGWNHETALYIVKRYDWGKDWTRVTGGRTMLMAVCEGGNLPAARYLIERKRDSVNARTPYIKLERTLFGRTESTEGNLSPIFFAAKSGQCDLIQYLISKGASVHDRTHYGATPLMYAVSAGRLDATQMLLSAGAVPNAVMSVGLNSRNNHQYRETSTAYGRAKQMGRKDLMDVLENAGAHAGTNATAGIVVH